MNNLSWRSDLTPSLCRSLWALKNKPSMGRTQYDVINDCYKLNSLNCVELFFNHSPISVQQIDRVLDQSAKLDVQYIYLIVNKFIVYTESDLTFETYSDLDLLLHWQSVIGWRSVFMSYVDNDQGLIGNFDFPVTQMLLQRND